MANKMFELAFQVGAKLNSTFKNTFTGANGQLTALSQNIQKMNAAAADVTKFKKLQTQTGSLEQQFAEAQAKCKQLSIEINNTANPTKKLTNEFNRAQETAGKLKDKLAAKRTELGSVRTALTQAGISTSNLAAQELKLAGNIDRAKRSYDSLTKSMAAQKAAQSKRSELKGQIFDTVALTAAASAPLAAFAELEDAGTRLKATFTDATGKVAPEFEKVNQLAIELGNKLPGSTADFQNMFNVLKRQGLSSQSILGGTGKAAAYLAVQLKLPFDQAANMAANLQDATGTAEKDMMSFMDTIQKAYHVGVEADDMVQGFSKLSPALMMAKQRGAEGAKAFAPLLAMMTQTGMRGESAGNAIRKVIQSPFTNTKALKDIQKQYKIDLKFTNAKGEFGGLQNMFTQLEKLKKLSTADRTNIISDLFGNDAEVQQTVVTLIEKGQAGYDEMNAKMQAQADLQTRVETQLGTLTNMWDSLKGTAVNALAAIGAPMATTLKPLLNDLNNFVGNTLQPFIEKNQKIIGTIGAVVAGLVLMKATLLVTGYAWTFVSSAIATIRTVIALATIAWQLHTGAISLASLAGTKYAWITKIAAAGQWLWNAAMSANPIVLIIAGIAALTAGLIYFFTQTETGKAVWAAVSAFVIEKINAIKEVFTAVTSWIADKWQAIAGIFGKVKDFFTGGDTSISMNQNQLAAATPAVPLTPTMANKTATSNVTYSPTINITGNADKATVQQAVKAGQTDFDKKMAAYSANQKRVAFGY